MSPCGMGRGGVPAFLPASLEGKVGKHLLFAVSCSQDQRMDNCGGQGAAVGGFHLNRRLSSRELTGHDHSRARASPDGPLSPPWSHVPLELPARRAPSASGPG